jgi:lipid-binding SYLF domain-containing protein
MKRLNSLTLILGLAFALGGTRAVFASDDTERLEAATETLQEILTIPDKGIPEDLLRKARCVAVVPGLKKGAFIVGAEFGKGFVSCRGAKSQQWSAPAAIRIEGGSVGFQIGGSETDVVLLVMNEKGADRLLSSKFKLGADASVAAGPLGRTANAATDPTMRAEILSWSKARGVFAGVSLSGSTLREDRDVNKSLYGQDLGTRDVTSGKVTAPAEAKDLLNILAKY